MYALKNTFSDVLGSYILLVNKLYFISNNILYEEEISKIEINEKILQINSYCNKIFIEILSDEDNLERTLMFDEVNIRLIEDELIYNSVVRGGVKNYLDLYKKGSIRTIYDINTKKDYYLDVRRPYLFSIVTLELVAYYSRDKTVCLVNFISGILLWSFSLLKIESSITDDGDKLETELLSFIGIYKKVFWILVTNRKIIGLDTEKGILLHEIDLCKELGLVPDTIENFNFSIKDIHLDEEKGVIKSLSYRYYWEMNLDTLKIEIKKDFGEKAQESWRINRSAYYSGDKNLYFIGTNKGEVVNRAVGIFDTEKLEVVWYDTPLEEKKYLFFTDVPQTNNKLLGVLDSENNLRVYEIE